MAKKKTVKLTLKQLEYFLKIKKEKINKLSQQLKEEKELAKDMNIKITELKKKTVVKKPLKKKSTTKTKKQVKKK
jgi:hypothetical protein